MLHKKIERLFNRASHLITICDELKHIYSEKFKLPTTTIMTGTNYPIAKRPVVGKEPQSITYMGNVSLNRYVSLIDVGRALDEINNELGTDCSLNIYTSLNDTMVIKEFEKVRSIALRGYVSGDEFSRVFHSSELLLHVEGFSEESIDRVKHSVSTKIADSLGSGIPLIAYGPNNVASMKHLIRNNCAIAITKKEELKDMLIKIFRDNDLQNLVTQRALCVANELHFAQTNSQNLYEILKIQSSVDIMESSVNDQDK